MTDDLREKILGILNSPSGAMKLGNIALNPLQVDFDQTISDLRFIQSLCDEDTFKTVIAFLYTQLTNKKLFTLRKRLMNEFSIDISKVKLDGRSRLGRKKRGSRTKNRNK